MIDLVLQTLQSLRAHALRFFLTSLGITWGAFMLTYSTATSQGMEKHFREQLERTGPRLLFLLPGAIIKNRVGERGARPVQLEAVDIERLEAFGAIDHAAPNLLRWNQIVRSERRTKLLAVQGVSPATRAIRRFEVAEGRFLNGADVAEASRVAFLGPEAARRLFGREPALGRTLHIEGHAFRVCGVGVEKGEQLVGFGGRDDQAVLVPYTTVLRWLTHERYIEQAVLEPTSGERSFEAIARTRESVGLHHGFAPDLETAISFINIHEVMQILDRLFFGLQYFMFAASLITLAVGAVSVMNIMLVVVAERTREIGLRKAVGAPGRAIFTAFLAETTAVCLASGIVGVALGAGLAELVSRTTDPARRVISPPEIDAATIIALATLLVGVGIVAGVVPAWRAARIPPAEALRAR